MENKKRASREREQYNQGLQRDLYNKIWVSNTYSNELKNKKLKVHLVYGHQKTVLEIGTSAWRKWLEAFEIYPTHLDCINISENELEGDRKYSETTNNKPVFQLMDAHELQFMSESFDMVFGSSILHHLELIQSLKEIHRVLKPNGRIVFSEPLDTNPVGKLIRSLTPKARTVDEKPFRFKELSILKSFFDISVDTYECFSVPLGILSRIIFKQPQNPITYFAYKFDRTICSVCPPVKWYYRGMTIYGKKYITSGIGY
jgi:SAM-dependent methyltransferase